MCYNISTIDPFEDLPPHKEGASRIRTIRTRISDLVRVIIRRVSAPRYNAKLPQVATIFHR